MKNLPQSLLRRLLLISAILMPVVCIAQSPESEEEAEQANAYAVYKNLAFGEPELVIDGLDQIIEPSLLADSPAEDPLTYETRMASIRSYQQAIVDKELGGGPWQVGLTEELAAIGDLYFRQGAYPEAIEANMRAMQVTRINLGLDNLEQVPIVEQLIESYLALDQWEPADQYQSYLFYIQKNAFGLDDPRMIPVLEKLAQWNLKAFHSRYGGNFALRLSVALYAFRGASEIVSLHFGEDDERFSRYLGDVAGTAFLMVANAELIEAATMPDYQTLQQMFEDEMRRINPENPQGYFDGLAALERLVTHYSARDGEQIKLAEALIGLGDWHLLFQRRRTAAENYRAAYGVLSAQENGVELVQEYMGQIAPLPEFSSSIEKIVYETQLENETNLPQNGATEVRFDTTEYGMVINLEILMEETEENSLIRSSLQRKVRGTVFRPVIEDGEMVSTSNNHFRYKYSY